MHPPYGPVTNENIEGHPYDDEIADWLAAIEEGRDPVTPFWDGANSTLAALFAVKALKEGRSQRVPHITAGREWREP